MPYVIWTGLESDEFLLSDASRVVEVALDSVSEWQNAYLDLVDAGVHCRIVFERRHHLLRKAKDGDPDLVLFAVRLAIAGAVEQSAKKVKIKAQCHK